MSRPVRAPEVCVVGLGYVGLPLAVALAGAGAPVVGFDVDESRVAALQAGHSHVEDIRAEALATPGLEFTARVTEIKRAEAYVICVPTPLREHTPDLTAVEAAAHTVGSVLEPGDLVVLESTTYPGTTEDILAPILEQESGLRVGVEFDLAYSPERIDPGNRTWTLHTTPKVVGGVTPRAADRAEALYRGVVPSVVRARGTREAEMAKLLENTFRHVNIALVNELAVSCHALGIDIWDVIDAAATKPFGFMPFYPGPGVGGHCIPVDPSYLSWALRRQGYQFRFVELAQEINAAMPDYVVARITAMLNKQGLAVSRSRILCLGVAYKPDVSDCRESPAVGVVRRLVCLGANVQYADPHVAALDLGDVQLAAVDPLAAECDIAVLLTAHSAFDLAAIAAHVPALLDTRGAATAGGGVSRL